MKVSKEDHAQALETLRNCFPKGSTVFTICDSVSRTGMSARFRVLSIQNGGTKQSGPSVVHPNWATSKATGLRLNRGNYRDTIQVNGCGFDRAYTIKEDIERALGYKSGDLNHQDI